MRRRGTSRCKTRSASASARSSSVGEGPVIPSLERNRNPGLVTGSAVRLCENRLVPLLFRRLHEKFDQIDATVERNTQAFERNAQASERNAQAFERNERAFEDLQLVIRENRLLQERSLERFE